MSTSTIQHGNFFSLLHTFVRFPSFTLVNRSDTPVMHEPHHSILSLFSLASFATIITLTSAVGGSVGGADDSLLLVVSAAAANITTDNSTRKNDAPAPQLLTLLPPPLRANNISTSFDDNTSLSPPPPSPYSLSEANSTTQNNNNNSIVSYVCNAPAFGKELSVPSCTNALHHLGLGSVQLLWGMREEDPEGLQGPQGEQGKGESQGKRQSSDARTNNNFDVLLPQRSISDDGACVVEPGLGPGVESARASWEDVAQAALVVVRRCAGAEPSRGGLAKNIGMLLLLLLLLLFFSLFVCYLLGLLFFCWWFVWGRRRRAGVMACIPSRGPFPRGYELLFSPLSLAVVRCRCVLFPTQISKAHLTRSC